MFDFDHPDAHVARDVPWSNYAATIEKKIALWVSPKSSDKSDVTQLRRHADVIRALLHECFQPPEHAIRVVGSAWSFSSVIEPPDVVLDPANLTYTFRVPVEHLAPAYAARSAQNFVPFYAEGGTGIATLNARLGAEGLALQTSGGGNGHRIAGCIATGTHGSALHVGALHDTVLAMHIVTGPDTAVLLQPASAPLRPELAAWLQDKTGIPTQSVPDDARFRAAQVSLGSFGIVLGVVVEAVPVYEFEIRRFSRKIDDDLVWAAIRTQETAALDLDKEFNRPADHLDVVFLPYPGGDRSAMFVTAMWKVSAAGVPFRSPDPQLPRRSADTIGIIGALAQDFAGPLTHGLARDVVQAQIHGQLKGDNQPPSSRLFPGEVFGPTTLPGGMGASTELAVDARNISRAINTIFDVLEKEAQQGRFLLGCMAVRFTKQTGALLGMNQHETTAHIELPSIRNEDVLKVFHAIWSGLDQAGISFACHWGQLGGFSPERTTAYYGGNAIAWTQARAQLLDATARRIFGAPILAQVGL